MRPNQRPNMIVAALFALALFTSAGCSNPPVKLEAGGPYSDPVLAMTDRAILDAKKGINDFIAWSDANSAYLTAKAPSVVQFVATVKANQDMWETQAFKARDAYASSVAAYNAAVAKAKTDPNAPAPSDASVTSTHATLQGALAVLQNLLPIIAQYRSTVTIKTTP